MNVNLKNYAIILASGVGSRFGSGLPKQFLEINGRTILERSIDIFEKNDNIFEIILVITPEYREKALEILKKNDFKKLKKVLNGGDSRKDSSFIGVSSVNETEANVLIHDCARPFLSQDVLNGCISALKIHDAVDVAIPSSDTVLEVSNGIIKSIPDRKSLMRSQTPQCFRLSLIKKAHELSKDDNDFTDDCGLIMKYNLAEIFVVEGNLENIKITYPMDEILAKYFSTFVN